MSDGGIAVIEELPLLRIVIDRPGKRNALSLAMWRALADAVTSAASRDEVGVVAIEGAGETFAAGADISELETMVGDVAAGYAAMDAISAAESAIAALDKPTIALIRGACIGGGLEIAMACDLRYAASDSIFMAPPARLGIAYSLASTRRLIALVGEGRATEMLFSPREVSAETALSWGLVNAVHPSESFAAATAASIARLMRHSPVSISSAKAIIRAVRAGHLVDTPEIRELRGRGFLAADFAEGVAAFRERRAARYAWGRSSPTPMEKAKEMP